MYYFLKKDFDGLNAEISKVIEIIKKYGQEMGKSCQEGAETFHDNFAYEDGERQQYMWSSKLRELIRIRNNARVVEPKGNYRVSLGLTVTVEDIDTGKVRALTIGSYMVLSANDGEVISYNAPFARMIIGSKVGDEREATIAGKRRAVRIVKIE